MKPLQAEYKALAGDLVIDCMGADEGNVGTAVDLIVRLILEPDETPMSALILYPFNATYRQVVNIDRLGIFSARYGTLTEWPLERVTSLMSGGKFDFPAARQEVWDILQQDAA